MSPCNLCDIPRYTSCLGAGLGVGVLAGVFPGEMFACTGEWRGQELVEMWGFRITGWEGMRILSQRNRHRVEEVLQQVRLENFE